MEGNFLLSHKSELRLEACYLAVLRRAVAVDLELNYMKTEGAAGVQSRRQVFLRREKIFYFDL